ncbi:MAG TPA: hypothetical protein VLC09_11145 [Polyangiaceae bacterium]|nr:hypothetical protein [Polyangiaceae bacterium]
MALLQLSRRIEASPTLLWHALSTAEGLSTWHADKVSGSLGERRFQLGWPSLGASMELQVERVDPHRQLVLRAGGTLVALSLDGDHVRLVHEGLDDGDDLDGFRSSWALALSLLEHAVTRHPSRSRDVHWFFQRAETTPELVHFYFSTALGLRSWLGETRADVSGVGERVSLELPEGQRLSGRVLSHEPGRDLALSWDELDGAALVLRTLPAAGGQRSLAVSLSTYGKKADPAALLALEQGLTRLAERLRSRGRG